MLARWRLINILMRTTACSGASAVVLCRRPAEAHNPGSALHDVCCLACCAANTKVFLSCSYPLTWSLKFPLKQHVLSGYIKESNGHSVPARKTLTPALAATSYVPIEMQQDFQMILLLHLAQALLQR